MKSQLFHQSAAVNMTNIQLFPGSLDLASSLLWAQSPEFGAINVFVGTVREFTNGNRVIRLEFEAYHQMALMEMNGIAEQVFQQWDVGKILIHHRTGSLQVGEVPVIISVSATHRGVTFEACRYIIDTLKKSVPIWKKEIYENGSSWVAAHP